MRRADRLFQIVQLLRSRSVSTSAWLASELGVSVRTVYRDLDDLRESGVPIEGEAGVGYRLQRGFELPPLTFTPDELDALVLGSRMVEAWADTDLGTAARSVLAKVRSVVPSALRGHLETAALFAPPKPWIEPPAAVMGILRRATASRRKVHMHYIRADGEPSERVVRPLGLWFWGTKWTLAGWCELRNDYRNFRPDRIDRLTELEARFDVDNGPNLAGFIASMRCQSAP